MNLKQNDVNKEDTEQWETNTVEPEEWKAKI